MCGNTAAEPVSSIFYAGVCMSHSSFFHQLVRCTYVAAPMQYQFNLTAGTRSIPNITLTDMVSNKQRRLRSECRSTAHDINAMRCPLLVSSPDVLFADYSLRRARSTSALLHDV